MAASKIPPPEIDSDEEDSGDWEEWQAAGHEEEGDEDEAMKCLFCIAELSTSRAVFQHCVEVHSFDFLKLRADAGLDFYDTLRLINFIRFKVFAPSLCFPPCGIALFITVADYSEKCHLFSQLQYNVCSGIVENRGKSCNIMFW